MSDSTRRELGEFLRNRRERLMPERVGIPVVGRRRTPGLRREEVAALAGVGVTWYTWLEQGRSINASAQVLQAVATTLKLTAAEQRHLWTLAGLPVPTSSTEPVPTVIDAFQPILDKLDPFPACVQNTRFDVLAYNRGYRFLFGDLDTMPVADRNCLRMFFLDGSWRRCYRDDQIVAVRMAAKLRAAMGARLDDPQFVSLVDDLRSGSADFDEIWRRHDVMVQQYDVKRIDQPRVGLLQLNFVWAMLDDAAGLRMSVMTPADEVTGQRLHKLADQTASLPDTPFTRAS
jgi:transcriptional regulator with XRE-family HTH domain